MASNNGSSLINIFGNKIEYIELQMVTALIRKLKLFVIQFHLVCQSLCPETCHLCKSFQSEDIDRNGIHIYRFNRLQSFFCK